MTRDPKLLAALAYVLGLVSGIVVLLIEKRDAYVRFHAAQSVIAFAGVALVWVLLPSVPVVGNFPPIFFVFKFGVVCLWGLLIWKALAGDAYRLPFIGELAHSLTHR